MNNNFQYSTVSYAIFHKPTNHWVKLEQDSDHPHLDSIVLMNSFENADKFASKMLAELKLQNSYMVQDIYGKTNFLEFDVLKFKTTYTLEHDEGSN